MTLDFHPLARAELIDAAQFYDREERGLGDRFLDEVERLLLVINSHPQVGRIIDDDFRALPTHRFPYTLIYRIDPDRLFMLAIAHQRRRPQYWARRVSPP